jgi:hypothetical protein
MGWAPRLVPLSEGAISMLTTLSQRRTEGKRPFLFGPKLRPMMFTESLPLKECSLREEVLFLTLP